MSKEIPIYEYLVKFSDDVFKILLHRNDTHYFLEKCDSIEKARLLSCLQTLDGQLRMILEYQAKVGKPEKRHLVIDLVHLYTAHHLIQRCVKSENCKHVAYAVYICQESLKETCKHQWGEKWNLLCRYADQEMHLLDIEILLQRLASSEISSYEFIANFYPLFQSNREMLRNLPGLPTPKYTLSDINHT